MSSDPCSFHFIRRWTYARRRVWTLSCIKWTVWFLRGRNVLCDLVASRVKLPTTSSKKHDQSRSWWGKCWQDFQWKGLMWSRPQTSLQWSICSFFFFLKKGKNNWTYSLKLTTKCQAGDTSTLSPLWYSKTAAGWAPEPRCPFPNAGSWRQWCKSNSPSPLTQKK